jgi:TRAP-type C4-dicarboxylate transport system permease small subunit
MKRLLEILRKAEVVTAALCFTVSCLVIFAAAIARTVRQPLNWSQDMALFLFAWSVFLSADAALRADKLVTVDLLVNSFSERWRNLITVINYIIIIVFLGFLLWFGVRLSYLTRTRVFQGIPGFSYTWVTLSVPVGALLMIFTVLGKLKSAVIRLAKQRTGGGES